MLSTEFISGYLSANGSFMIHHRNGKDIPVFQVKTNLANKELLDEVALSLGLTNSVHTYTHGSQSYALLLVRDRFSIENKIIATFDGRLRGYKLEQFNRFKEAFIYSKKNWKFQNVLVKQ